VRAARYNRAGDAADVLELAEVEVPVPGPGEVRVALVVSGVNPTDWKVRRGTTASPPSAWQVPHHDGAGTIDAVGAGVDPGRIDERVWVWLAAAGRPWGTAAEWTVVPSSQAMPLPDDASFELGASLGVPAITAHRCLFADGPLDAATVLVAGGAGAVGHFAIELAKHAGATVITTVSGDEKARLSRAAGADAVVNYRAPDALAQIQAIAPTVDRIVEVAFGANADLDLALARPGTVISIYASEATDPTLPLRRCMSANVVLRFVMLYGIPRPELEASAREVTRALYDGALTPLPVHRFPLDQVAAAQDAVEAGSVGKVLVDVR
jgi:NADPH2:quinone reductase